MGPKPKKSDLKAKAEIFKALMVASPTVSPAELAITTNQVYAILEAGTVEDPEPE